MFGKCRNWSKCSLVVLLSLLLASQANGTTIVVVVTPQHIVVATDTLGIAVGDAGRNGIPNYSKAFKIKGKFIVALTGLSRLQDTPVSPILYEFQDWIGKIEAQVDGNTSISNLADIIEKESARTFQETLHIESRILGGTFNRDNSPNEIFAEYVVAGFEKNVPTLIRITYKFDWYGKRLVGPERKIEFPKNGEDPGVFYTGMTCAIKHFGQINSYANKRLRILAPALNKPRLKQGLDLLQSTQLAKALIRIEAEVEPGDVGGKPDVFVLMRPKDN